MTEELDEGGHDGDGDGDEEEAEAWLDELWANSMGALPQAVSGAAVSAAAETEERARRTDAEEHAMMLEALEVGEEGLGRIHSAAVS